MKENKLYEMAKENKRPKRLCSYLSIKGRVQIYLDENNQYVVQIRSKARKGTWPQINAVTAWTKFGLEVERLKGLR